MHTFQPGDTFYYFEVVRVLGAGADGAVYEIRHRQTGDRFALKTMHAADSVDPNKTARALVAARGNYWIEHRGVVRVHDLNCEPSGLVWMRTELLNGLTLAELLARQGRVSLPFGLAVAIEAAAGLAALHEAQIIHRDVKPSNLFYTQSREVKVLDLSLAKVFPEGLETTAGGRRLGLGTPAYSAPEQLEGVVRPDVRFDVYGLGLTLWEMLAGRHPHHDVLADVPELIKRQLTVMPPRLSEVAGLPPRVDDVVRRAIAKEPMDRYASMMEMSRALRDLAGWIGEEARCRRILLVTPHGEPSLPGDANTWRDYRPAEPTPEHYVPPPEPGERVILTEPTPRPRVAPGLAATLAMDPPLAPAGPLPPTPSTQSPTAQAPRGVAIPSRETPAPVSNTQRGPAGAPHPRRTPWTAVIGAGVLLSLASVTAVVWVFGRRPQPAEPAAQPPSASPVEPPAPPPPATLQVEAETPIPPAAAPPTARPSASAPAVRRGTPPVASPPPQPPTPLRGPPPARRAPFGLDE